MNAKSAAFHVVRFAVRLRRARAIRALAEDGLPPDLEDNEAYPPLLPPAIGETPRAS